jgi:NTP pyrophosphatase (non-canonical NTP hydrolase)
VVYLGRSPGGQEVAVKVVRAEFAPDKCTDVQRPHRPDSASPIPAGVNQNHPRHPYRSTVDIRSAQQLAWDNKLDKGFNTTDTALEFGLLTAEVSEAFTAWRKRLPDLGEELADVFIYLTALAEMNGIDLQDEVRSKLEKNRHRTYRTRPDGVLERVSAPDRTP